MSRLLNCSASTIVDLTKSTQCVILVIFVPGRLAVLRVQQPMVLTFDDTIWLQTTNLRSTAPDACSARFFPFFRKYYLPWMKLIRATLW